MSDFGSMGSARPDASEPWDLIEGDGPDLASAVVQLVDWIADQDRMRMLDGRVLEDLYDGRWVTSDDLSPGVMAYREQGGDPVKLNFARNAVDFVATKVCAETPSIVCSHVDDGADDSAEYTREMDARRITEALDGIWEHASADDVMPLACLDALRTGTACVKTFSSKGRPGLELVPTEWLFIDPSEARCGSPRSLYERRPMTRRAVEAAWADGDQDAVDTIRQAPDASDPLLLRQGSSGRIHDLIDVYEAWSLPDPSPEPEAGDDDDEDGAAEGSHDGPAGRHVVCVHGRVLLDEPWTCIEFPHAFLRLDVPPVGRGFWGQGLLERLDEAQAEIDFLLGEVSEQIRLARLRYFVQAGERKLMDQLAQSSQGSIIPYDKVIPTAQTPSTVSQEAMEHIGWLVEQLYSVVGMSEQAATSQRPAGINSGRAILFFHDFQTRRYVDWVRRYSSFCVDVASRLIDRSTDKGLDMEGKRLQLEPVSAVPSSYAGRMQRIEQLISQGQVPEGYWTQYLGDPDAWRAEHRASSQADHMDWLLETLRGSGGMPALSDHLDMEMAKEVLNGEILMLIRKGAPQTVIDRHEDMFDRIVSRQKELAPPPVAQPPAAAGPTAGPQAEQLPMGGLAPQPLAPPT